jgi:hypothetical protein
MRTEKKLPDRRGLQATCRSRTTSSSPTSTRSPSPTSPRCARARGREGRVPRRQEQRPARRGQGALACPTSTACSPARPRSSSAAQPSRRRQDHPEVLRRGQEARGQGRRARARSRSGDPRSRRSLELPSLDVLRAQLLGLLITPASSPSSCSTRCRRASSTSSRPRSAQPRAELNLTFQKRRPAGIQGYQRRNKKTSKG